MFASNIIQLSAGGKALKIQKIINKVNKALKLLLLIFLFNKSIDLIPEYSILINWSPSRPNIKGEKKLKLLGNERLSLVVTETHWLMTKNKWVTHQQLF